ncbi:MAG: MBL fold metallo-hydrolase [Gemmatimonadota bacterium]
MKFRMLLLVSGMALRFSAAAAQSAQVVMLGTGTPHPDPERSGPALAVVAGGRAYLVDAGAGIVRRAVEAAGAKQIAALQPASLDIVFITHLHSDHTIGLPDLIHTPWVAERPGPLRVFGPPGIKKMMEHLTKAWSEDIRIRTKGPQPSTPEGWKVVVQEIKPGVVFQDSNVTVTAFAVSHTNWKYAFGYRFESKDRRIVISGDARPSESVVRACDGCDVLVHEVYSVERLKARVPEWQRYHQGSHTSTTELAALATRARPKLLVLYHQLYWGATDDDLLNEMRAAGYQGPVRAGRDLEVYP